jgi:hypothetical protein
MTTELLDAAAAMAETLQAENAALASLDIGASVRMYARKRDAMAALTAARATANPSAEQRQQATTLTRTLLDLTNENKRLLERALYVQGRIMRTLARAVPRALAPASRYRADGRIAAPYRPLAFALSARI